MNYLKQYQKNRHNCHDKTPIDLVLVGAGIMSATLATLIKILQPNWNIHIYERLNQVAQESSNAWNNAGTGHSAFCELNYTTQNQDGSIDISKAIKINESFEMSRQLWSYFIKNNFLNNPQTFINNVPHMSFVWGNDNIQFLRKRFNTLQNHTLFYGIQYSENTKQIEQWAPLIMDGRNCSQKIAATYMETGTDINFGEITQQLIKKLETHSNYYIYLNHKVTKITNNKNKIWSIHILDHEKKQKKIIHARHIFIGAGGGSLPLLQTTGIQEIKNYAGFPVGGQFLITRNKKIIKKHLAKVYGITKINTPPMSVPHIDTRIINGSKFLLFGPFATFSGKFLKYGSQLDIFHTLTTHNLLPILQAGKSNIQLIKYLIKQVMMSHKSKFHELCQYYPNAKLQDWSLLEAGQRVQIIKKDNNDNKGILQFGTEIINSSNGTLSALLGASPGASTTASIMLKILHIMFKKEIQNEIWIKKIKEIIPSYNHSLNKNIYITNKIKKHVCDTLKLKNIIIPTTSKKI